MRLNKALLFCLCLTLAWVVPTGAQDFRGRINGTVTDNTGAVLPGVTVTATSPALIQPQVQVTGADGVYRFIALPPGVYEVDFELAGFQNVKREGVRVVINQTLTVDQQLNVATLQETVTVTGASPVVDTSTTQVGTNFTKELLTEIPNARDIWAAMAQAPGIQMTGYDVGGSRTGTQTGFLTYGFDDQNQTKLEGIDTTEGTDANAGYFDFGSFEEFQVGGAGTGADSFGGGTNMSITVKSGGDRFTGNWYSDWQGDATISDNVPDAFRDRRPARRGRLLLQHALSPAATRSIASTTSTATSVARSWKQQAWFFYSYRLNDQYKYTLGHRRPGALEADQRLHAQGHVPAEPEQPGHRLRQQAREAAGTARPRPDDAGVGGALPVVAQLPLEGGVDQRHRRQGVPRRDRRQLVQLLPAASRPTSTALPATSSPGRIDTVDQPALRRGTTTRYQDQKRYKPQVYVALSYFKDGWGGSARLQGRLRLEARSPLLHAAAARWRHLLPRPQRRRERARALQFAESRRTNDVVYNAAHISDSWRLTNRLTLNLGLRFEAYTDGFPDQSFTPNGHAALVNWPADVNPAERARYQNFIAPVTVQAREVASTFNVAPRAGFAYDLTGDNRTVVKGYFGRFYFNSADTLSDPENPVGSARLRYRFNDLNGNRLLDGPQELGTFNSVQGGAGFVNVDDNIKRPYSQELSGHLEREIITGLSGRFSYVYKQVRDEWVEIDPNRAAAFTIPFSYVDIGADGVRGTSDDQTLALLDRPATVPQNRYFTNPTDPAYNSDFQTVEFAINRRFADRWMLLTSFGYTWLDQFHATTTNTGALDALAQGKAYNWRENQRLYGDGGKETSTLWNYKLIGRYTLPWQIGFSGSWKVQSGRQYGRNAPVAFQQYAATG